jgi:hypothetical protein
MRQSLRASRYDDTSRAAYGTLIRSRGMDSPTNRGSKTMVLKLWPEKLMRSCKITFYDPSLFLYCTYAFDFSVFKSFFIIFIIFKVSWYAVAKFCSFKLSVNTRLPQRRHRWQMILTTQYIITFSVNPPVVKAAEMSSSLLSRPPSSPFLLNLRASCFRENNLQDLLRGTISESVPTVFPLSLFLFVSYNFLFFLLLIILSSFLTQYFVFFIPFTYLVITAPNLHIFYLICNIKPVHVFHAGNCKVLSWFPRFYTMIVKVKFAGQMQLGRIQHAFQSSRIHGKNKKCIKHFG